MPLSEFQVKSMYFEHALTQVLFGTMRLTHNAISNCEENYKIRRRAYGESLIYCLRKLEG